ncbi:MAG: ABC transporter substrate-binding protein [Candidatus Eremiobacteraeota bacterium]|nr:ABC transporter substrate-binding protein [Candidatus Eremiobacteraeota bacterium]
MQSTPRLAVWLLVAALCSGCAHEKSSSAARAPAQRVVALMPAIAEDLYAIGAGSNVVGVSSYTDVPQAKKLPRVADFSSVDTERIVALHPDAVVGIPAQSRLVEPLIHAGVPVSLLNDDSYDDIFSDILALGTITGHDAAALKLVARLQRQTRRLHEQTGSFARHPSVFVVLGTGPIWTAGAGSYIGTLIALAGGTNAAGDLHAAYGEYSAEALLRDQPDAIVTDPAVHLEAVLDREPWRSLHAVQRSHVYVVKPAATIERPGPNYNEGLQWLVERLTPLAQS